MSPAQSDKCCIIFYQLFSIKNISKHGDVAGNAQLLGSQNSEIPFLVMTKTNEIDALVNG